jgi:hypothetical protein
MWSSKGLKSFKLTGSNLGRIESIDLSDSDLSLIDLHSMDRALGPLAIDEQTLGRMNYLLNELGVNEISSYAFLGLANLKNLYLGN